MHTRSNIKNNGVLHRNYAPCQAASILMKFFSSKNVPVASQPLYSPDLSTCDFFLFYIEKSPQGTTKTVVTDQLKAIALIEFQSAMRFGRTASSAV